MLAGCSQKTPDHNQQTAAPEAGQAQANLYTDVLASALFQMQPDNLGIDSGADTAVSVLNSWREQTGLITVDKFGITTAELDALPKSLLTDDQRAAILATDFANSDAFYLRNCIFFADMAKHASQSATSELDRVMALFNYSMRTISLLPEGAARLPVPLFEVVRLGKGSAGDRGWLFSALLKQQRIDAVIIQSKSDPNQQLSGVVLDGQVYLFDPRLGLPIPRGDDPPGLQITRPATWSEMLAHPDWWQALTVRGDLPYPWTVEELAAADVLVYAEAESWTGRMKLLESILPAESASVIYDALFDSNSSPGLMGRVARGNSAWSAEQLRFWPYPLTVRQEAAKQREEILSTTVKFQVPFEFVLAGESQEQFQDMKPTFQHAKSRIEQLSGKYQDATAHYLTVRHLMLESLPAALQSDRQRLQSIQQVYALAVFDATYWTAMCKFEQQDWKGAAKGLSDYLKRFSQTPWSAPARFHWMLSLAEQGDFPGAQAVGSTIPVDDPYREPAELLLRRWERYQEQSTSSKTESQNSSEPTAPEKNAP
ncbi:MAG: hypothetical protein U0872_14415 [Planctomycetaceae bacterium]